MPGPRASRRPPLIAATLLAGCAVCAAGAQAKPPPRESATPDQLRQYVSSGTYLTDVQAAVAPARAFLETRMDEIDAQAAACRAANRPIGSNVQTRAASAPAARAAATARTATGVLLLRKSFVRGARVSASGATVTGGRKIALRVSAASVTDASARLTSTASITLKRGSRKLVLRSPQVRLTKSGVSISAVVGAKRVTVLTSVPGVRRPTLSAKTGAASVVAVPLRPAKSAARTLKRVGLSSGRAGIFTVRVPAKPSGTPAPSGSFTPTPESCKAVPAKPAMVLDIDETALSAYLAGGDPGGGAAGQAPELFGTAVALPPTLELYKYARSRGVAVDFITARITPQAINTGSNLDAQGYGERIGITFRSSTGQDAGQYKRDAREALQTKQGYTILANVGDQCSDLYDGQAERSFKLPNTFYFTAGKQDASCDPNG